MKYKWIGRGVLSYKLPEKQFNKLYIHPGEILPDCIPQHSIDAGLKNQTIEKVTNSEDPLKKALTRLTKTYKHIIIDSPAGLEHLNRKITSEVEDIFDIIDPSKKSFEHVERAYKIAKEIGVEFENFYVVGGYRFPENLKSVITNKKFKFLGKIPYDKDIEDFGLLGKSLLELSNTSPAYLSIKKIMEKANY